MVCGLSERLITSFEREHSSSCSAGIFLLNISGNKLLAKTILSFWHYYFLIAWLRGVPDSRLKYSAGNTLQPFNSAFKKLIKLLSGL